MKSQIRSQILEQRNALSEQDIKEKSIQIIKHLFSTSEYKQAKTILWYASYKNEVHTLGAIEQSIKDSKKTAVPKMKDNHIMPAFILSTNQLVPSEQLGIPEPINPIPLKPKNIDLVIVPGVAFDRSGNRIGYGKGHYDAFLRQIPKATKIALAFNLQLINNIESEEHDIKMNVIVTEKEAINIKSHQQY